MLKKKFTLLSFAAAIFLLAACSNKTQKNIEQPSNHELLNTNKAENNFEPVKQENTKDEVNPLQPDLIAVKYKDETPKQWGERVPGIETSLDTSDKVIALTFDACGGPQGDGYDEELINYLIKENVPASLFINYRWIESNNEVFLNLAKNPLFEIENHGYFHRPLSVNGKSVYGIKGTKNIQEVVDEVLINQKNIEKLTGRKPKFFRPGTAYSDEIAESIARDLGEQVVGYNVLGDAGATYNKNQIKESCLKAQPGSIILLHMNHPEKQTYEGMKLVIPELKKRGFRFVQLSDYKLK